MDSPLLTNLMCPACAQRLKQSTKKYASNQLYPMHIQHVIVATMLWCHCGAQAATLLWRFMDKSNQRLNLTTSTSWESSTYQASKLPHVNRHSSMQTPTQVHHISLKKCRCSAREKVSVQKSYWLEQECTQWNAIVLNKWHYSLLTPQYITPPRTQCLIYNE